MESKNIRKPGIFFILNIQILPLLQGFFTAALFAAVKNDKFIFLSGISFWPEQNQTCFMGDA